jgi:hypothetical protein
MPPHILSRILRNYHRLGPSKFHAFNQRVLKALADNPKIPASTWGSNPGLITSYFEASEKHDKVYHQANYGSSLDIAERELLEQQLINYLDEIAADLEAEAVRTPEILVYSGFDLAKERRGLNTRKKVVVTTEAVAAAEHNS